MSDQYVGEIRMTGFNFAPQGWALCNGQTLPIAQNNALFALIGTTYGGNGSTNFNLPNLQGRVPVHQGTGTGLTTAVIGESAGTETVTLLATNLPSHSHLITPPVSNVAGTAVASPPSKPSPLLPTSRTQQSRERATPPPPLPGKPPAPIPAVRSAAAYRSTSPRRTWS